MKLCRLLLVFIFMSHNAYALESIRSVAETNAQVVQHIERLNNIVSEVGRVYEVKPRMIESSDIIRHKLVCDSVVVSECVRDVTPEFFKPFTAADVLVELSSEQANIVVLALNAVALVHMHKYVETQKSVLPKLTHLDFGESNYESVILDVSEHINQYRLKHAGNVY